MFFVRCVRLFFFFFLDTATTEIYTLSLHDALPICLVAGLEGRMEDDPHVHHDVDEVRVGAVERPQVAGRFVEAQRQRPRSEETRLNSSHSQISYAVFCLKKKKQKTQDPNR